MNARTVNRELLDDLRHFFAKSIEGSSTISEHDAANEVVSRYTDEPFTYSDGSPVGVEYVTAEGVVCYQALRPPHRRSRTAKTEEHTN